MAYHNKPRFYLYDDFLGQTSFADKLNKNEEQKLIDFMNSINSSKKSVFVLTTREYILNQAKLHYEKLSHENFDHRTCIINLHDYSRRIKAQILYNHLHFSNIQFSYIAALIKNKGYISIVDHQNYSPRLIQYLTDPNWIHGITPSNYTNFFLAKLDNPIEIWDHAFRYQISEGSRSLLYILITMPNESPIQSVELAFSKFHSSKCNRYNISYSMSDFSYAIKEIDGTFIITNKNTKFIQVSFQNLSIRDYMQNLLLNDKLFSEMINSIVFFDQIEWVIIFFQNKWSSLSFHNVTTYISSVIDVGRFLYKTDSCMLSNKINLVHRLAVLSLIITSRMSDDDIKWIDDRLYELSNLLNEGKISPSSFLNDIEILNDKGWLSSYSGQHLLSTLKMHAVNNALSENCYIDDFEALASILNIISNFITESELVNIKSQYIACAQYYVDEFDFENPEEIREEASRMANISDIFKADTSYQENILRDKADEIEAQNQDEYDDYEGHNFSINDSCSNEELDSIFETLV